MIYLLKPEFVKKPWGIRGVKKHTGISPPSGSKYGEVYLCSAQVEKLKKGEEGVGKSNQIFNIKNTTLSQLIKKQKRSFLGNIILPKTPSGKTEAWYFGEVKGKVKLVTGLKIKKSEFKKLIKEKYFDKPHTIKQLEKDILKTVIVKTGDSFLLSPGAVHTIWPTTKDSKAIVYEVQQGFGNNNLPTLHKILMVSGLLSLQVHPSDKQVKKEKDLRFKHRFLTEPTVRFYDFGRGRESFPEESIRFIDFSGKSFKKTKSKILKKDKKHTISNIFRTKYFSRDIIEIKSDIKLRHMKNYHIYTLIQGTAEVEGFALSKGSTFAVSAKTRSISVKTTKKAVFLRDYKAF